MKFSPHLQNQLQEASNTQLKIKAILPNVYFMKCALGETIIQGGNAIQLDNACARLMKRYPDEKPSDCLLIAANPILALFNNPFFNNPELVSRTLQRQNATYQYAS